MPPTSAAGIVPAGGSRHRAILPPSRGHPARGEETPHHGRHRPSRPANSPRPKAAARAGKTTKDRHGTEHSVRAGKLGFAALARQRGYAGGTAKRPPVAHRAREDHASPDLAKAEAEAIAWAESYRTASTSRRAPAMTNAERRERRREAGRKGTETRRAKAPAHAEEGHQVVAPEPPRIEPPRIADRREDDSTRRGGRGEAAHEPSRRAPPGPGDPPGIGPLPPRPHPPMAPLAEAMDRRPRSRRPASSSAGFIRPDGVAQADPIRRKGKWRL